MIHTDGKQTIANAPQGEAVREGSLDGSGSVPKPRDPRYIRIFTSAATRKLGTRLLGHVPGALILPKKSVGAAS